VTARFFWETMRSNRSLTRQGRLELPMLLMQSGADPIVDAPAVQSWFDGVAPATAQRRLYPSFGHILDFEAERQRYWDDLVAWLDATAGPAAAPVAPAVEGSLA
jgi:alpha-beta hydrolase superfamily lysophospholipase